MARYTVRWVTHAEAQRDSLSAEARAALEELLDLLADDPRRYGRHDAKHHYWSAPFGDFGLLIYTIEDALITITVLRVL